MRQRTLRLLPVAYVVLALACRQQELPDVPSPAEAPTMRRAITYDLRLKTSVAFHSRKPSRFALVISPSDGRMPALEPSYNANLHVIAVSRDLKWYTHLHPEMEGNEVPITLTFPRDGSYVLFAYFHPVNLDVVTKAIPITIGTSLAPMPNAILRPTPAMQAFGAYRVEMSVTPQQLRTSSWGSFTFRAERNGVPVERLGSEGSLGHLAIVREGASDFVFAHSTVEEAGGVRAGMHVPIHPAMPDESIHAEQPVGPQVTFHAFFSRPGRYKLWAEFTPDGRDVVAEFVVEVIE